MYHSRRLIYPLQCIRAGHLYLHSEIDLITSYYRENLKFEREIVMPTPSRSNMFGVPLEELMGYDGEKNGIPRVVKDCIAYLRGRGMPQLPCTYAYC